MDAPTHFLSLTVAEDALVRRAVAADADSAAVGAVGPLLVGVATVVEMVADAVAVTAVATDERAQRPVEALRQQAALGVQDELLLEPLLASWDPDASLPTPFPLAPCWE